MSATDLKASADLTGLNRFVSNLFFVLHGTGQNGDIHRFLRTEAGQLAWDISQALGPKSPASATRSLTWEMKKHLSVKPAYSNLETEQQYSSTADFTWLYAGKNFVAGINDEDNQVRASADEAKQFLRTGQATPDRGDAWQTLGYRGQAKAAGGRGRQHLLRLNRVRVSASAFNAVRKTLTARIGELRASFAYTASRMIPSKPIPNWLARHFPTRVRGKAVFNEDGLLHPLAPFIEFGSNAKGVNSNPFVVDKIARAVEKRKYLIHKKINQIVRGYTYNWNTGQVFKPEVPEGGIPE